MCPNVNLNVNILATDYTKLYNCYTCFLFVYVPFSFFWLTLSNFWWFMYWKKDSQWLNYFYLLIGLFSCFLHDINSMYSSVEMVQNCQCTCCGTVETSLRYSEPWQWEIRCFCKCCWLAKTAKTRQKLTHIKKTKVEDWPWQKKTPYISQLGWWRPPKAVLACPGCCPGCLCLCLAAAPSLQPLCG